MSRISPHYDCIIIGAGAAGLMCAIEAGKRRRSVLLIDHAKAIGEKIRISGGGRCNFTNLHASPANYLSQNPHFCVSALRRYPPQDFIRLVEKHRIAYHEKTLGQLFCDDSAKDIIAMLQKECEAAQVQVALHTSVRQVEKTGDGFRLALEPERNVTCQSLVIATGGPSIPKMGATGWGYTIAEQFGLPIIPPHAALVPFTLGGALLEHAQALAGVSAEVTASCNGHSFREAMLFTHRGLSGPAILQISSYWQETHAVEINLLPDQDALAMLKARREEQPKQTVATALATTLPKRLAQHLAMELKLENETLARLSNATLDVIAQRLNHWRMIPAGTEGYRTAEVTRGGVGTDALSSKTFECKHVPGLYFIGEVMDVTGHLGGYNFQWAWASGHAAGQYV